jgi:hypothetical protein
MQMLPSATSHGALKVPCATVGAEPWGGDVVHTAGVTELAVHVAAAEPYRVDCNATISYM